MKEYVEMGLLLDAISVSKLDYLKVTDVICKVPTADVAPVVHAKWKDGTCTNCECGLRETWFDEPISYANIKYCPYCGARMDKGGDAK